MSTVIFLVAVVALSLVTNKITGNKDHPGRLVLWLLLLWLASLALLAPLWLIFHPQTWVLWVSGAALGFVVRDPKWVKRSTATVPPDGGNP